MPFNEFFRRRSELYPKDQYHYVSYPHKNTDEMIGIEKPNSNVHIGKPDSNDLCLILEELLKKFADRNRIIVHSHDPRLTPSLKSVLRPYRKRAKLVHTVHNNFGRQSLNWRIKTTRSIMNSDYSVFCSKSSLKNFPLRRMLRKKVSAIQNGVDLKRIRDAQNDCKSHELNSTTDIDTRIKLVTVTKSSTQKNTEFLVRLAHSLNEKFTLKIIGSLSKDLYQVIEECRPTNIETTGIIGREEVYCHFMNSDIFVSSSLWEGLPIGVMEAMACGLPVILSDIPAHREIVEKEHSAYKQHKFSGRSILLEIDQLQWQDELNWYHKNSPKLDEIGNHNRSFITDNFNLQNMHSKYTEIYDKLLGRSV